MDIDWDRIRKHAYADVHGPSDWPQGIKPISLDGTGLFGLDAKHRLYWDGKLVHVERGISLTFWQKTGAIIGIAAAVVAALASAVQAYIAWIELCTK
ncbi:MAG: hypothetical protein WC722_08730 [Rhodospirillales bacterium]|jgi:hypothetical protein